MSVKIVVAILNRKTTGFPISRLIVAVFMLSRLLGLPFVPEVLDVAMGFVGDVLLDKGAVAVGALKQLHL